MGKTRTYDVAWKSEHNYSKMKEFRIEKASDSIERKADTIVVIFFFYGATERAMKKYCNLYHAFGFDVMYVPSYLKAFARPTKSSELANNVLLFLKSMSSSYKTIVIHAFSMGAYKFNVCVRQMYTKSERYGNIQENIKAVIYDSITIGDFQVLAAGVAQGASGNKIIQTFAYSAICAYFLLTYPWTLKFYIAIMKLFRQRPLQVPTLLFTSEDDQLCPYELIQDIVDNWRDIHDLPIVFHSWETSKHSAHLLVHKDDYVNVLSDFLNSVPGLTTQNTRL